MVCCGTEPSPRVRARTFPVQYLLCSGYKRGLHAFEGGERHHRRFLGAYFTLTGRGVRGESITGEPALATLLWGILYADDAGGFSQSPEQLGKIIGVIVVVCAAFGLTVAEAKTEIMCLRTKTMPESTATLSIEAAGQVSTQTNKFVYYGGGRQPQCRPVHRGQSAHTQRIVELPNVCPYNVLYDLPSAPLELKIWLLRAEVLETMMLYGCPM